MTRLAVRVQPGASRSALKGWRADGALALAVGAAPERGRANRAALALLAEVLGIAVSALAVARGETSRSKWIEIEGLTEGEVKQRIDAALAGKPGAARAR